MRSLPTTIAWIRLSDEYERKQTTQLPFVGIQSLKPILFYQQLISFSSLGLRIGQTSTRYTASTVQCTTTSRGTTLKLPQKKQQRHVRSWRGRREWENEIERGMTMFWKTDGCTAPLCVSFLRLKKRQINSRLVFGSNTCVISAPPAASAANGLWKEVEVLLLSSDYWKDIVHVECLSQIYSIAAKCNRTWGRVRGF